jgi:hypothetical protein
MPLLIIGAIGLAALAIGEGVNLAGQGMSQASDATVKIALAGGAVYLAFIAMKGAKS